MSESKSTKAVWKYERTLEFALPIARTFSLFTDPAETRAWLLPFEDKPDGEKVATIEGRLP
ncbi:MAG: hypothetical protein WAM05_12820 [Candidatus Binataceae bacterium]